MSMRVGDVVSKPVVQDVQLPRDEVQQATVPVESMKPDQESSKPDISPEKLQAVTDEMNKTMDVLNHALRFTVRDDKQLQVQVIDSESKKVIREIPPEEMLDLADKIKEMVKSFSHVVGMFVDELI
ncbi:MAG: flagellar protein FlaG [Candidatus Saccharibacteria bacterium]